VSQAVILSARGDAWAGTVANVFLLVIVAFGWLTEGPRSFHAQHLRDARAGLARAASGAEMDRAETVTLFNDMCLLPRVPSSISCSSPPAADATHQMGPEHVGEILAQPVGSGAFSIQRPVQKRSAKGDLDQPSQRPYVRIRA
jgi:hypothetical protein